MSIRLRPYIYVDRCISSENKQIIVFSSVVSLLDRRSKGTRYSCIFFKSLDPMKARRPGMLYSVLRSMLLMLKGGAWKGVDRVNVVPILEVTKLRRPGAP